MTTFTPYNNLSTTEYDRISQRVPWTKQSLYKPVEEMPFKQFIYLFGDYMLNYLNVWRDGTEVLSDKKVAICKAYYETACEMHLTNFEFDVHFIGLQYQPSEEENRKFDAMERTIVAKMRTKLGITDEITFPNELWRCIKAMI